MNHVEVLRKLRQSIMIQVAFAKTKHRGTTAYFELPTEKVNEWIEALNQEIRGNIWGNCSICGASAELGDVCPAGCSGEIKPETMDEKESAKLFFQEMLDCLDDYRPRIVTLGTIYLDEPQIERLRRYAKGEFLPPPQVHGKLS